MIFTFFIHGRVWGKYRKVIFFPLTLKCRINLIKQRFPSCNSPDDLLLVLALRRLTKLESKVPECYGTFHHFQADHRRRSYHQISNLAKCPAVTTMEYSVISGDQTGRSSPYPNVGSTLVFCLRAALGSWKESKTESCGIFPLQTVHTMATGAGETDQVPGGGG